jgi:hypothetical protein
MVMSLFLRFITHMTERNIGIESGDEWGGFEGLEAATLFAGKEDWQQMLHKAIQAVVEC